MGEKKVIIGLQGMELVKGHKSGRRDNGEFVGFVFGACQIEAIE